jgi:hypothetical protein
VRSHEGELELIAQMHGALEAHQQNASSPLLNLANLRARGTAASGTARGPSLLCVVPSPAYLEPQRKERRLELVHICAGRVPKLFMAARNRLRLGDRWCLTCIDVEQVESCHEKVGKRRLKFAVELHKAGGEGVSMRAADPEGAQCLELDDLHKQYGSARGIEAAATWPGSEPPSGSLITYGSAEVENVVAAFHESAEALERQVTVVWPAVAEAG